MKRSLQGKLILSYLVVALITVLVVSVLIRVTSGQSLMNLVVEQQTALLKESAQTYYTANGTMEGFFDYYVKSNDFQPAPSQPGGPGDEPGIREIRGLHGLVDTENRALIPTFGFDVGQTVPAEMIKQTIAVDVDGKTIAYILPDTKLQFKLSAEEELYLQRTTLAISLAALAGILVALGMGFCWQAAC